MVHRSLLVLALSSVLMIFVSSQELYEPLGRPSTPTIGVASAGIDKLQVRVIPLGNADFTICVAWGKQSDQTLVIKKFSYSMTSGDFADDTVISVVPVSIWIDFHLVEGDPECSVVRLTSNSYTVGPPFDSQSTNVESTPQRVGGVMSDFNTGNINVFLANYTAFFDAQRTFSIRSPETTSFSWISLSNIGELSYLAVLGVNSDGGPNKARILQYLSGAWGDLHGGFTTNNARKPATTSWSDHDFMYCYDNGATIANQSTIFCRSKSSPATSPIDGGSVAQAIFTDVNVSPVDDTYALVTATAHYTSSNSFRMYTVRKSDAMLVQAPPPSARRSILADKRSVFIGNTAADISASAAGGNLIMVATFALGQIQLQSFKFNVAALTGTPPISSTPDTPVASPGATPQSAPATPGTTGTPTSPTTPTSATPTSTTPSGTAGPSASLSDAITNPSELTVGAKAGIGVAVCAAGLGAGLFVLLFLLKKKRQQKKKAKEDETPMTDVNGDAGKTYSNIPNNDASKYGNMDAVSGKYSNITRTGSPEDDGIAVPTNIQPSEIDKRMHIPYKSLVFVKEVGAGSYGKVYLGEWRGAKVAIKVSNTVTDVDGFLAEAKLTLGITPHPNLVQTFGVSLDGPNPCIVLEYCGGGSLDQLFTSDKGLTNEKRLEYALKIGYGLAHLHNNNIVHRDLAARNILLTNDGQPKISDFGMSRIVQEEAAKGRTKTNFGPIRWMAPESLKDKSYSLKTDVWSFGITLWEIVAGKEPHEDEDQLEIALKIRDRGVTPAIPDDCEPALKQCMEMCWKFSPADRPSMESVCEFLRSKSPAMD